MTNFSSLSYVPSKIVDFFNSKNNSDHWCKQAKMVQVQAGCKQGASKLPPFLQTLLAKGAVPILLSPLTHARK